MADDFFSDPRLKLRRTVGLMNAKFKTNSTFTPFIKFTVNNLVLDTRIPGQQYITSLTNELNGSGQSNKFSLTVTFTNNDKDIADFEDSFLNIDEDKIEDKNICTLQYGYCSDDNSEEISTDIYTGILLNFNVNIKENFVSYVFSGYSGFEVVKDVAFQWYPGSDIIKTHEDNVEYNGYIENMIIGGDPLQILTKFVEDVSKISEYKYEIKVIDPEIKREHALKRIAVPPCNSKTPVDYINFLLSMMKYEESSIVESWKNKLSGVSPTISYSVRMSEKEKKTIEIYLYLRKHREFLEEFSINSGTNNLLLDFDVDVDGSVALAIEKTNSIKTDSSQVISSNGQVIEVSSVFNSLARSSRSSVNQNVYSSNIISNKFDFEQTGSATLIGIPCEIPIGSVIRLNKFINNEKHRASGDLFVETSVDEISSNNIFTTTLKGLRLKDDNNLFINNLFR